MNYLLNLKSFFKFLEKNKAYTAIDIFGLSVSLMFVILIAVYTGQELSTDRFQKQADRIYLFSGKRYMETAYPLAYRIQERYPEVEKVCPVVANNFRGLAVQAGGKRISADLMFADTTFFSVFSFPLVAGNVRQAMESHDYAVVSETFARKAFPNEDPIGQRIQVNDSLVVTVNAVMADIKRSVIPYCDVLINIDNVHHVNSSLSRDRLNNAGSSLAFLLMKPGATLQGKEADMLAWLKGFFWIYSREIEKEVYLIPLRDVYFNKIPAHTLEQGDQTFVMALVSVGLLILIFAVINYINLTVAQTGFRAKEMATRRLLGSTRSELFGRLVVESTLLCLISFLIGLLLAFAVKPYAESLLQARLELLDTFTPGNVLIAAAVILLVGGLAGLIPAVVISDAKPIEVVRGSFRTKSKMVFSKFFITFQNVITIVMLACSLTMILQIRHMIHAPLGYRTHNIIDISAYNLETKENMQLFVNELKKQSCVSRVALSEGSPLGGTNNATTTYEGRNISFQQIRADQAFFDMLGIEMIRDNHVASTEGWYFNEQALREMNLATDAASVNIKGSPITIRGVFKDFRLGTINDEMRPMMFQILKDEEIDPWNILVEVRGNTFEAMQTVQKVWEDVTHLDFAGTYIDQQVQNSFNSEIRLVKIIGIFTGIAILISLLGLLAMSTYFIQQRRTEVAVRKVFGSTNGEVLVRLVRTFLTYVCIAFLLAIPVIWYFMRGWLDGYSYRIALSPLIFVAAFLLCLIISFVTVFFQSWRAANANPVKSFRMRG